MANMTVVSNDNKMDVNSLAAKFMCQVCKKIPERPFAAEDGYFYHEECIQGLFNRTATGAVFSPVTGQEMGRKIIYAKTIKSLTEKIIANEEVDRTLIRRNSQDSTSIGERVRATRELAQVGSAEHMALFARWHLFGEQDGMECDPTEGYQWSEKAADKGDANGMAYQGICLLHGYGVDEPNRNEGFELLVDAANEGSTFAAYKLGSFYYAGVHGFKEDRKRAEKWLRRAQSKCTELNESENENVFNYLSTRSTSSASETPGTASSSSTASTASMSSSSTTLSGKQIGHASISGSTSSMSSLGMFSASERSGNIPHMSLSAESTAGRPGTKSAMPTVSET